jgi:subtilisin family serine protease
VEFVEQAEEMFIAGSQPNPPSYGLTRVSQADRDLAAPYLFPDVAGKDIDVYVIDTGILTSHPDFQSGGVSRARWGQTLCPGCPNEDDNGHGTVRFFS